MRPLIPPPFYYDVDHFALERERVFATTWQLGGFTSDIPKPNDFITVDIAGHSVVIQNFDGVFKAFANVCSHRFSRIRSECKGNGPLRCPYHGWIYNDQGIPYSIPSRPRFDDLTSDVVESLRLRAYDLALCGPLIFVRATRDGPSLEKYFGAAWPEMERMGSLLGDRISGNSLEFEANWKVAIENALESYHVGFVHQNTFKKLGTSGMDFRFAGDHSAWMASTDAPTTTQMSKLASLYKVSEPVPGYFQQHLFPNLTAVTLHSTSYGFHHFEPLSPTTTRITSHLFMPRLGPDVRLNPSMSEMMNRSTADFAREVFSEDRVVCEGVQRGIRDATHIGLLSDEEERVFHFQRAYMAYIGSAAPAVGG